MPLPERIVDVTVLVGSLFARYPRRNCFRVPHLNHSLLCDFSRRCSDGIPHINFGKRSKFTRMIAA